MPPPPEDNFQREISHKPVDITLDEGDFRVLLNIK